MNVLFAGEPLPWTGDIRYRPLTEKYPTVGSSAPFRLRGGSGRIVMVQAFVARGKRRLGGNLREMIEIKNKDTGQVLLRVDAETLEGIKLVKADLAYATLEAANLQGAKLTRAQLHQAVLRGANLSRARLQGAWLSGGDLAEANLEHARLDGAYLYDVNLTGADLTSAILIAARYDARTRWPDGFDPRQHEAVYLG